MWSDEPRFIESCWKSTKTRNVIRWGEGCLQTAWKFNFPAGFTIQTKSIKPRKKPGSNPSHVSKCNIRKSNIKSRLISSQMETGKKRR